MIQINLPLNGSENMCGRSLFTFNENCITTNISVCNSLIRQSVILPFPFDKIVSSAGICRLLYIALYMRLCICGCLFVCMHTCVYCETAVTLIFLRGNQRATIMMLPLTLLQSLREFHLLHSLLQIFIFLGVLHDQPSPGPLLHIPFREKIKTTEQMLITPSLHLRACDVRTRLPVSDCLGGIHCNVFISAGFTGVGVRLQHPFCNTHFKAV